MIWAQHLADKFVRDGIATPESAEVVRYGLEALADNLLVFLMTVMVGFYYGSILSGIIVWILTLLLRKYAGGYHAKTKIRCYLTSVGMLVVTFALLYQPEHHPAVYVILVIISGSYIFMNAPVDHENKVLDVTERRVYRKRARIVLILEGILFVIAWMFGLGNLMAIIVMCFSIVGVSLVMGKHLRSKNNQVLQR